MDSIGHVLSLASQIYTLVEKVKANKKRCWRVADRVRALEKLLRSYRSREAGGSSADVEQALRELSITLSSAQQLIQKYTLSSWVERVLSSRSHGDEFSGVNERLNDAFQALAGAEQLQQGNLLSKVFELSCRHREDEDDRREDITEMETRGSPLSSVWSRWCRKLHRPDLQMAPPHHFCPVSRISLLIGCSFLSSFPAREATAGENGRHDERPPGAEGQRGDGGGRL